MGFTKEIFLLIAGALVGGLTQDHVINLRDHIAHGYCGTRFHLDQANAHRRQALILSRSPGPAARAEAQRQHWLANASFRKAADCGSAMAVANVGTAICFGWAEQRDVRKGWEMIRTAAKQDSAVAIEWFSDRAQYCPEEQKTLPRT